MLSLFIPGCATTPQSVPTAQERFQRDTVFGLELSKNLEKNFYFKNDITVDRYLTQLAQRLASPVPELRLSPLNVQVIADFEGKWRDFSLPGNRVYLSGSLLKSLEFEHSVAAAIALELAHVRKRHALEYFRKARRSTGVETTQFDDLMFAQPGTLPDRVDYFSPSGVFAYSEATLLDALRMALEMLYGAGFDPRGMLGMLTLYQQHPSRSPYEQSTVEKLIQETRRVIALQPPLRNPIVRSEEYLSIQARMQKF